MTVQKSKRSVSDFEFYTNALRIRQRVTEWMLRDFGAKAKDLKLFVNPKKTMITPLRHGFTFMKIKYRFSETGKITKCLSADAFSRERRRLKNYKRFVDAGRLTRRDVANFYQSFRGSAKKFDACRSIKKLDALYNELFLGD